MGLDGRFNYIVAKLCASGGVLSGDFACAPGSRSCLSSSGTITGTVVDAYHISPVVSFPGGAYCNFGGLVTSTHVSGRYTCHDSSGQVTVDSGDWSMDHCS